MRVAGFVVHLARAAQRRPQAERLIATLPVPASIVDAVDGRQLDADAVAAVYARALHRPRYPFELLPTEIGVFLSHRRAWAALLARGLDAALIVEDDVEPEAAFGEALDFAISMLRQGDYLRFPYRDHTDRGRVLARRGHFALVEPRHTGAGMQMQLVTRGAAERLLTVTERFDRPVDSLLQMRWLTGVRMLAMRPGAIREIGGQLGGTVTQKKQKALGEVVSRAAKRAAYRLALRLRDRGATR